MGKCSRWNCALHQGHRIPNESIPELRNDRQLSLSYPRRRAQRRNNDVCYILDFTEALSPQSTYCHYEQQGKSHSCINFLLQRALYSKNPRSKTFSFICWLESRFLWKTCHLWFRWWYLIWQSQRILHRRLGLSKEWYKSESHQWIFNWKNWLHGFFHTISWKILTQRACWSGLRKQILSSLKNLIIRRPIRIRGNSNSELSST